MKNEKKTDRKPPTRFLSVVPVTSRETTGTTPRQPNIRGMMLQRIKILAHRNERDREEMKRLTQAVIALGKRKQ